ncbi:claspin isoform X1 [Chiloscyllium punctatum]|uniref:claspin isoform X1 n=2 Tax=Chiloscyllium punctatum TaxID=137246 RepID=UPI003B63297A
MRRVAGREGRTGELLTFGEEKTNDSDNDSGKGSYGMVSPCSNKEACHNSGDSEEEIFTRKKMTMKPLQESDSDGEACKPHRNSNSKSDGESEYEEQNLSVNSGDKSKRLRRVRKVMLDSDESDSDIINGEGQVRIIKPSCVGSENEALPIAEIRHETSDSHSSSASLETSEHSKHRKERRNRKDKSQRQREKSQKTFKAVEKLKRKKKKQEKMEESTEYKSAEDSGCLLNNSDLFETEMDDVNEFDAEEELSLDAIRAAVKKKAKQFKRMNLVPSGENLQDYDCQEALQVEEKKVRIERKAAKQSKEAMRQIHSETQRLMRESSLSLPYHLPQPKTIHDFFKKRPRPACQGSAMSLLKSAKYQSCLLQGTSEIPTEIENINTVPQDHGLLDQLCNNENVTAVDTSAVEESNSNNSNKENICPNRPECEIQVEKHKEPVEMLEQPDISTDLESNGKDSVNAEYSTEHDNYSFCLELTDETGSSDRQPMLPENPHEEVDKIVPDSVLKLSSEIQRDTEEVHKQLETTSMVKQRKSKLDKLRVLGVDLTLKPRLCADEGAFVNLEEPKENKELQALKERFLKHGIKPVKQNQERRVELNTIRKTIDADGKEDLKADLVVVTLGTKEVEEFGPTKPGEKLQVLKAKLQEAMKLRRVEERQKRQALYQLDNEQGFENEEDEEEELTESEEDDHETVEFLLGDDDAGVEADNDTQSTDTAQNQSIVTQKESTQTPKPIALEFSQAIKAGTAPSFKLSEQTTCNKLRLQLQQSPPKGDSKIDEDDSTSQASTTKENSHNSSFELIGSMIPSYQPCNKQPGRFGVAMLGGFRSPSPNLFNPNSQFRTSFISSASKSSGKLSEPSMPVEDSQDLYNTSPEPKNSTGESQFRFSLEDETQSQLLDSDGFLNVGHRSNKWQLSKRQLLLDSMDENAMDANMGELLGYCSGEFKSQNLDATKEKSKEKEQNFDELLELCSGKFLSPAESSSSISSAVKDQKTVTTASDDLMTEVLALCSGSFPTDKEEDKENEDGQFQLLTDDEVFKSEDERSVEEEDDEKVEDEEQQMAREVLRKRKLKLKDFVEDEAELSGSEVASDDESDAESDDYEEDIIEEELPSDEELQEQVNKIHMKALMDEDKRKLRLYQEHYLADGDLHSDGPGRARKFRWKNIDDSSQIDLFHGDSEDEPEEEEVDDAEVKWRKDRFEREQWFREQSQDAGSEEEVGEDSQFMKLAKKITVKTLQKGISMEVVSEKKQQELVGHKPQKSSVLRMRNGSLLNQPREVLQKLATMSEVNLNAPRANSRKFVFHTLSPEKDEKKMMTESKPQMKRKAAATPIISLTKRPRIEKTPTKNSHTRSIFRYLEK